MNRDKAGNKTRMCIICVNDPHIYDYIGDFIRNLLVL